MYPFFNRVVMAFVCSMAAGLFAAEMPDPFSAVTPSMDVSNLAVFLDGKNSWLTNSGEESHLQSNGEVPPVMPEVIKALEQKTPLILHSIYLDILLQRGLVTALTATRHTAYEDTTRPVLNMALRTLRDEYRVKVNPEGDFAVALPDSYPATAFDELGFDTSRLKDWEHDSQIASGASLSIPHFKALFNKDKNIPKNIFAIGHGTVSCGGFIMMMEKKQYTEFLQALDAINTKVAYITSCQLGGMNAIKMHDYMTKFSLILGSSNDSCPANINFKFNAFFKGLRAYCEKLHSKERCACCGRLDSDQLLEKALYDFYDHYYSSNNIPLLRLPGQPFFRAVEISPHIESITMEKLEGLEKKEEEKEQRHLQQVLLKGSHSYTHSTDRLLYPASLDIPLWHESGMYWHSMIGGNALHVLSKVKIPRPYNAQHPHPHAALWAAFGGFCMESQTASFLEKFTKPSVFYKAFVIRLLQSCDQKTQEVKDIYEPVVVGVPHKAKELIARVVHCSHKSDLANTWLHMQNFVISTISQTEALAKMKQMIKNAQPDPEALWHATDGRQNLQTIQEALPDELQAKNNDTCVVS